MRGGCVERVPGLYLPLHPPQELPIHQLALHQVSFVRKESHLMLKEDLKAANLDAASGPFLHWNSRIHTVASNQSSWGWERCTPKARRLTWDMWITSNQRRIPGSLYAVTKEVLSIHMDCAGQGVTREGKHLLGNLGTIPASLDPSRPAGSPSTRDQNKYCKTQKHSLTFPLGILSQREV